VRYCPITELAPLLDEDEDEDSWVSDGFMYKELRIAGS